MLLDEPLQGPVYIRPNGGEEVPDAPVEKVELNLFSGNGPLGRRHDPEPVVRTSCKKPGKPHKPHRRPARG